MAEQTYTPGPWRFDDDRDGYSGRVCVFGADGSLIVCTGDMETCDYQDILDAHLIAAAPEMLAALETIWQELVNEYGNGPEYIAAAIAKAKGGS